MPPDGVAGTTGWGWGGDFVDVTIPVEDPGDDLLIETGDKLLIEIGDFLLLETG